MIKRGDLDQLTKSLKEYFHPNTFMEIGSRDGHDSKYVCDYWGINDCYIIEAHPNCYDNIKKQYINFNIFNFAASNKNGNSKFNALKNADNDIVGMSSLLDHNAYFHDKDIIDIETKRMDTFLNEINVIPDLIKIDVEGFGYQVLESFGEKIEEIKAIQIETEQVQAWVGQILHPDILEFMESKGFELIESEREWDTQLACLFINKKII